MLTRRQLLLTAGAATAALAAAAGGIAHRWVRRPAADGYRVLSFEEAAYVRALAAVAWPGAPDRLDGADAALDHYLDQMMVVMPGPPQDALKVLLHALDDYPLPTRGASFHALDRAAQEEVFQALFHHDLHAVRSGIVSVVVMLGMGYTTHPEMAATMSGLYKCGYGS